MTNEKTHSRLICDFKYKNLWLYFRELVKKNLWLYFRELVKDDEFYDDKMLIITEGVLTPWVVRQAIDNSLEKGWKLFSKDNDFVIKDISRSTKVLQHFGFRSEFLLQPGTRQRSAAEKPPQGGTPNFSKYLETYSHLLRR